MVNTVVEGTYRQTNLTNESPEYLAAREELRLAEIELMRQRERVAEMRRRLPEGAVIEDYQFEEGPRGLSAGDEPVRRVRLSELFTKPDRSLVIYHFMYGKKNTKACPMCTAWLDGANGVAHHLAQRLDFVVVAAARCADAAGACSRARLGQAAAVERRREHVQVRSGERVSRRRTGLDGVGFHARRRRDRAAFL